MNTKLLLGLSFFIASTLYSNQYNFDESEFFDLTCGKPLVYDDDGFYESFEVVDLDVVPGCDKKLLADLRDPSKPLKFRKGKTVTHRSNFIKAFGACDGMPDPSKYEVHHAVEQQAVKWYPSLKLKPEELHNAKNLRGILYGSDTHRTKIRAMWDRFYANNPEKSKMKRAKINSYAKFVDDQCGHLFVPKLR